MLDLPQLYDRNPLITCFILLLSPNWLASINNVTCVPASPITCQLYPPSDTASPIVYVLFSNLSFPLIVIVLYVSALLPAPVVTIHVILCSPILKVFVFVILFLFSSIHVTLPPDKSSSTVYVVGIS